MIGSIIGDVVGVPFEFAPTKDKDFVMFSNSATFSDDSILTIATADALLNKLTYEEAYLKWSKNYPRRGYGNMFLEWIENDDRKPYNSYGNGSAMRVSPIAYLPFGNISEVMLEAKKTSEVTHNHEEGIRGAQAIAAVIFLAINNIPKDTIKNFVQLVIGYDLNRKLDDIRPTYGFEVSCQSSVPESIICFLESTSFEDAIRLAISMGGDADTMACITGGIAEAYYKEIPKFMYDETMNRLPNEFKEIIKQFDNEFRNKFGIKII